MAVRRIYVEKRSDYAVAARDLEREIRQTLAIGQVKDVRILIRYDVEHVSEDVYRKAVGSIFSEPPVDLVYEETFPKKDDDFVFSVEYLPGQFDQRADSACQCIRLLNEQEEPEIRSAFTYVISGNLTKEEQDQIIRYCLNPVDSRLAEEAIPDTLENKIDEPADIACCTGFCEKNGEELKSLYDSFDLAMTFRDFLHIQNYFRKEERRDPTMTEIRVLDTYWSDHCRHTTFRTELKKIEIEEGFGSDRIEKTLEQYREDRKKEGRDDRPVTLMDLAGQGLKRLKREGKADDVEESEDVNACSIIAKVPVDGKEEEWLIDFKNETHNHPTEIEPFGGAATCLGGAIRDPLSDRTYVYQAMRITGAADPRGKVSDTPEGKLPQKTLVTTAAKGYSSYGNQIGLATGYVKEIYHPDYVAKRMELGAVMGAAPKKDVIRRTPVPGDLVILLGGRTGRDGCGGATGSSKAHTTDSLSTCGAEVQKGNAPTERKIQRLFRREEVAKIIKKCNDFGAGGVSVAIGELADGLCINLDLVPKKYAGLNGTEIAISESQERMAVVVDQNDADAMIAYAASENLEAVAVAEVTEEPRLVMKWRGKTIVSLSRAFLDTNGAHQETDVIVNAPDEKKNYFAKADISDVRKAFLAMLSDLSVCSQKGLVEMFDASIGAGTVTMPFGGRYQSTPTQTMVAKLPVKSGECDTVTMMAYGFDPVLSSWSPYHGAVYAVCDSAAKIAASGGDALKIRLSFQEYFRKMTEDPHSLGEPLAALLGAYDAQIGLSLPSLGGKDSMSGSFGDRNVPPTFVSFAVDVAEAEEVVTPEFKAPGSVLVLYEAVRDEKELPDYEKLSENFSDFYKNVRQGLILSAYALGAYGIAEAVAKMAFGNRFGVVIDSSSVSPSELFAPSYGSLLAEVLPESVGELKGNFRIIGTVSDAARIRYGDTVLPLSLAEKTWEEPLESVFPTDSLEKQVTREETVSHYDSIFVCRHKTAKPVVWIPVLPGTNCEYDCARAFEEAGAVVHTTVMRNQSAMDIRDSVTAFEKEIRNAQILMFPGGFSAGDEPDGSAKFFATVFRNDRLRDAVSDLLDSRDGLILGICNGFQALIKLGLVPYGKMKEPDEEDPTLAVNAIGRHISHMAYVKVVSDKSPWLRRAKPGGVYVNPISHGEGRFVADRKTIDRLFENGQVATQYVDCDGNPAVDEKWNPNGSYCAIEGITSPDGRIYGKMAHAERCGKYVAKNITGEQNMELFCSGVEYFL